MGRIEIVTEPHELIIDGTTILMQADPTADDAWDTLMKTPYAIGNKGREELMEALAGLAQSPEDADTLRKLNPGGPTVNVAAERYIEAVTGFPLGRPERSIKGSKKTGGT